MNEQRLDGSISVDVEDWFMGIGLEENEWGRQSDRLAIGLERILRIFDEAGVKATFFVLGWVAEKYPAMIRRISSRNHEIGTHGWSHRKIYDLEPHVFREELRRSITAIETASGNKVRGHRAAYFSITENSLWAIDILEKEGIRFDSSIYPAYNYRYGIPNSRRDIHTINGTSIREFPITLMDLGPKQLGIGGAYLRILPLWLTIRGIRQNLAAGRPVNIYVHPWEFDPEHPRVKVSPRIAQTTHYWNLHSTRKKLRALLRSFRFGTISAVLGETQ